MKKIFLFATLFLTFLFLTACNKTIYQLPKVNHYSQELCFGSGMATSTVVERIDKNDIKHYICSFKLKGELSQPSEMPLNNQECFKEKTNVFMTINEALTLLKNSDCKYKNKPITDYACNPASGMWSFSYGQQGDVFIYCEINVVDKKVKTFNFGGGYNTPGNTTD